VRCQLGRLIATHVEFKSCGKTSTEHPCITFRYFSGTGYKYSIFDWFVSDIDAPTNRITECSFHDTLNAAIIAYVLLGGFVFPQQTEWCIFLCACAALAGMTLCTSTQHCVQEDTYI